MYVRVQFMCGWNRRELRYRWSRQGFVLICWRNRCTWFSRKSTEVYHKHFDLWLVTLLHTVCWPPGLVMATLWHGTCFYIHNYLIASRVVHTCCVSLWCSTKANHRLFVKYFNIHTWTYIKQLVWKALGRCITSGKSREIQSIDNRWYCLALQHQVSIWKWEQEGHHFYTNFNCCDKLHQWPINLQANI